MQRGLALALLALLCAAVSCDATYEGQALLNIQTEYGLSTNWSGLDPCAPMWSDVNCSSDGHVIGLNLSYGGLTGPLIPAFGELNNLQYLNLGYNSINGTIPSYFANLTNLSSLIMTSNSLTGPFPPVLLNMTNLTTLALDITQISGSVPPGIKNLQKLQHLYLGNNSQLSGPLPSEELGLLKELLEVTMWGTTMKSTLPRELGNCTKLRYINFHSAEMYGPLPDEYGYLPNLQKLLLHNNNLKGEVPSSWTNLMPHLIDLEMQNNQLYGNYPTFMVQQAHGVTSISCNYFDGPQPVNNISVIYTKGNCFQEDLNAHSVNCPTTPTCNHFYQLLNQSLPNSGSHSDTGVVVGSILGSLGGLGIVLLIVVSLYKWRQYRNRIPDYFNERSDASKEEKVTEQWEVPKGIHRFTIQELAKATDQFGKTHHIGVGGFGQVYSGCLEDGTLVAIKRASPSSLQGRSEFRNELELLSRLHHRHLVRLEGFCDDVGQQILVYELMKNGNLGTHLSGKRGGTLSWYKRMEVALGVALGLEYLHSFADPPVIHRDVKPSNILLDDYMVAKLADFGISKVGNEFETHISTRPAGTAGFLDPDYFVSRQLTPASDVYSFGVVLLELITGQEAIDHSRPEAFNLLVWVKPRLEQGGINLIVDSRLQPDYPREAYTVMTNLALKCASYERPERPSMKTVVNVLDSLLKDLKRPSRDYASPRKSFTGSTNSSYTGTHSASTGDDSVGVDHDTYVLPR